MGDYMFIFNLKLNKNIISKISFIFMIIIILIIFIVGIYLIFIKPSQTLTISDTIKSNEIFEVTNNNYTNILNATNKNIDSYVGCKVQITGYVYRLLDFENNQFVIARDMLLPNSSQTLVVGFLCEYDKALDYKYGEWINIVGEIKKGNFKGDIAILNIISIDKTDKPENPFVCMPDDTYLPTANMF